MRRMGGPTVCTIVARNYLPGARVLARSVLRQHPDADVAVLLIDDRWEEWGHGEPFRVVRPRHIGLGGALGAEMAGTYSLVELATASKPWLLEHLIRTTGRPVLYLDPDCQVHSSLDALVGQSAEHHLVVTPHTLRPFPRDGLIPDEAGILGAGIYNLGFLGVGPSAPVLEFLEFWKARLRRDAVVDMAHMLFTDQRWVDFIDCFPHVVLRDSSCNVAYWNVWGRSMARSGTEVLVDGTPLTFFHFSGFDPQQPHVLSVHQGDRPRVRLSEHPILAELCRSYGRDLMDAGYLEHQRIPYGWASTATGLRMDSTLRSAWRSALARADSTGDPPPPGPFAPDGGQAFSKWLQEPLSGSGVTHYEHALWSRHVDLQLAFPDCLHNVRSARGLADWLATDTTDARAVDARAHLGDHLRTRLRAPLSKAPLPGLNFFGYPGVESGVGQAGRLLVEAAAAVGLAATSQTSLITPGPTAPATGPTPTAEWTFDTNVFCVNADALGVNLTSLPEVPHHERRRAGVWFWEAEIFPEKWYPAFDMVDEVWAPSRFIADALERTGRGPVRALQFPIPVPTWTSTATRADLGLPEGFLVLFTFDWDSVRERKNPDGLMEAYARAFSPADGAHLVLKSINGQHHWAELEQLTMSVDRPDIHIIDALWPGWQVKAAMEQCDCYASLHRSEGLGLTMGEAMALGKPVVASAWSGNMDFMTADTASLIPVSLTPIPESTPVYGHCGRWAEPDLDAAAAALRRVHDDPRGAQAMGQRARAHLAAHRSLEATGRALAALSEDLRFRRSAA
jgi:glycosyltransferase involved in cell wall biosynthesis